MKMQDLLQARAALIDANEKLLAKDELSAEDRAAIDENNKNIEALTSDVQRVESQLASKSLLDGKPPVVITGGTPNVTKDPLGGFKSAGDFYLAVQAVRPGTMADERLTLLNAAASGMNMGVGHEGGFLVPAEISLAIWNGMRQDETSLIGLCDQYPISGESLTMNAEDETSRATGSRWGGVRAYWLSEAAQFTASKPKFRQVKLEPHELGVFVYVTDKLLRNSSAALESYLSRVAAREINFLCNNAIINGSGVGQPQGILTATCLVEQAKETSQTADTLVAENISKMYARRLGSNHRFLINREVTEQLDYLNLGAGATTQLVYMPPGGLSNRPYATIKGCPVIETEYNPQLGEKGDIILADFGAYAVGVKGSVLSAISMHLRFDYAETCFRFSWEMDGQPWLAKALTPFKATSGRTLSPFVTLAERA
jgi:HK97 family phage major capsid protein